MKKIILVLFVFSLFACEKEEVKMEIFSPEAFAFQLEEGWELNASVQVKGFNQIEENNEYLTHLVYSVTMITSENDTINEADFGEIKQKNVEELMDYAIDMQIELDSGFPSGNYKMIIDVTDMVSGKRASREQEFELEKM